MRLFTIIIICMTLQHCFISTQTITLNEDIKIRIDALGEILDNVLDELDERE